jgi:ATP/maltotriose-dependent transcriptional regulator MalT
MIELLRTKLFIPRPRSNRVSRPRLVERLNSGLDRKLTLIAAPAGFGKTSLLSEWIPQSPRCVTWLSLDEADNDSTRFWTYFISSLQGLQPQLGESALALLQSFQNSPINSILTALINDISAFPDAFAMVLDDYHIIESQSIHEALTFLIAHLPANMHLVMTTRIDPPLPLARLRARDKLTEIRANELRFTADETESFLAREVGKKLTAEEVAILEARTEGWIAGLQIAALSMQGREDISDFIRAFSGSHRHILGYLADEAINQRPKGTLNFLLQTSILDRLCGPLCDAVTGESNGQIILENLEHANLFISPLDDEGRWYRYHPLFAEVLQARLRQVQGDRVSELHDRARNWHARQGMMEAAIRHALAGKDFEETARLIEAVAGDMLRQGSSASLTHWLEAIPEEIVRSHPRLCLARGWTFFMGAMLNLENSEKWAQLALHVAQSDGSLDSDLTGEVDALQAMITVTKGDVTRSREFSEKALDSLPLDSPWRRVVTFTLGTTHLDLGNVAAAARAFAEALRLSQAEGDTYIQLAAASFLADTEVFQGQLDHAMEMYQQVLAWTDSHPPQKGTIMAYGGLANILCERGQFEAARAQIQMGADQVDLVGGIWSSFVLSRVLARLQQAQGNWRDALDILNQAHQTGQSVQVSLVVTLAAALRANLQLAHGDLNAASAWAENCGLGPDDAEATHAGWREVEYLTLARVLDAQGRHAEALSLLERLLESAQAEDRGGSAIGILVIQAIVHYMQGNRTYALECLEDALTLAEPEGYIRIFVDEGEPMRSLLGDYRSMLRNKIRTEIDKSWLRLLGYTDKLLAAFSPSIPFELIKQENILEPLSVRELDILRLIATGCTNKEIADRLVIAISTVKSHINNLYSKLGVRSRTQAISVARDLGLFEEINL